MRAQPRQSPRPPCRPQAACRRLAGGPMRVRLDPSSRRGSIRTRNGRGGTGLGHWLACGRRLQMRGSPLDRRGEPLC
eukprot:3504816-Prymnesium_polylepis.1